jgi:hypothetical protein
MEFQFLCQRVKEDGNRIVLEKRHLDCNWGMGDGEDLN